MMEYGNFGEFGVWYNPGSWGKGERSGGYCDRTQARFRKEMVRVNAGEESRQKKANKHLAAATREGCDWAAAKNKASYKKRKKGRRKSRKEERVAAQMEAAAMEQIEGSGLQQSQVIEALRQQQMAQQAPASMNMQALLIPAVAIVGILGLVIYMRKG